jgi:hypothetical protein
MVFSMTLFQSLVNAAGYDPLKGPGSDCSAPGASGQCVVPWAGRTKAVSSVVLISNGVSFAVRHHHNNFRNENTYDEILER